ncbi:MAG TPA: hypothetical protein VEQ66_08205 [Propionibacteriaceae bacterium]|nr:hypothetical protein [Propionibacteriaceae bacterium]
MAQTNSLHTLREPAVVVLLVVLGLRLLLGLVTFLLLARGAGDDTLAHLSRGTYGDNPLALASFSLATTVLDLLTALVLVGLVASCVLWRPTPHARQLTLAALVLVSLAVVVALAAGLMWLTGVDLGMGALADFGRLMLGLPLLVLAALTLGRLLPATAIDAAANRPRELSQADGTQPSSPPPAELPAAQPSTQPTWQPDEAAGAAWTTAGDAATGAAASGWGTSAERGGWVPQPTSQPAPPAADEHPWRPQP